MYSVLIETGTLNVSLIIARRPESKVSVPALPIRSVLSNASPLDVKVNLKFSLFQRVTVPVLPPTASEEVYEELVILSPELILNCANGKDPVIFRGLVRFKLPEAAPVVPVLLPLEARSKLYGDDPPNSIFSPRTNPSPSVILTYKLAGFCPLS